MPKRKPPPAPPAPPECPQCTTPRRCGTPCLHDKRGPRCVGRANGIDECDCINWCGDDPWLQDGRARGCAKFYGNPCNKPQPIYPRVIVSTDIVAGPFTHYPMIYVLIVLWWPASSQSGKQIAMHDFNTSQACEAAKRLVLSSEKPSSDTLLRAYCTPKG